MDLIDTFRIFHPNADEKVKRQPSEWEKNNSKWNNWQRIDFQNILAAHTNQYQKNKQPKQEVGKRPKQTFLQRNIQMADKHLKRCSTSLSLLEKFSSFLQWLHYIVEECSVCYIGISAHTYSEWPSLRSTQAINAGEGVERGECTCTVGGNVNCYSHNERQCGDSLKN